MRFSDLADANSIAAELERRLSCTTSTVRRNKHIRAACNAIAALSGISLEEPNLDDDAMAHAIPLSLLEDARHSGADDDAFDDRLHPIVERTDNRNPAEFNYDQPQLFEMAVERDGYVTVQKPGLREPRKEPVRTRKVALTPPAYLGIVRQTAGDSVPAKLVASQPVARHPLPDPQRHDLPTWLVNRIGWNGYSERAEKLAAVVEHTTPAIGKLIYDAEEFLSFGERLPPVGSCYRDRQDGYNRIVQRVSYDTVEIVLAR